MSEICEAFHCTPDEALRQDWSLVRAIFDYRTASAAVDTFSMKDRKHAFDLLESNPGLLRMLSRMNRAQRGLPLNGGTLDEGRQIVTAKRDDDGE